MLLEFIKSFIIIVLAEIGDKTQLLALSLSLSYSLKKLFFGFLLGSILSQGLAVILGYILGLYLTITYLYYIAAAIFICFGFLNILNININSSKKDSDFKNPIYLIAATFFMVELGDKTQLSAFAVSLNSNYPIFNLLGGIAGILSISVVFILMTKKLGSRVPEKSIKIFSSFILIIIGLVNLTNALPSYISENIIYVAFLFIIVFVYIYVSYKFWKKNHEKDTSYNSTTPELYNYYRELKDYIDDICLGYDNCGKCLDEDCIIGFTKRVINDVIEGKIVDIEGHKEFRNSLDKDFNKERIYPSLAILISFIDKHPEYTNEQLAILHKTRNNLEKIIFGKSMKFKNINYYLDKTRSINKASSKKIEKYYRDIIS